MDNHIIDLTWAMDGIDQTAIPFDQIKVNVAKLLYLSISERLGIKSHVTVRSILGKANLQSRIRNNIHWELCYQAENILDDIPELNLGEYYSLELVESELTYLVLTRHDHSNTLNGFDRYVRRQETEGRYVDSVGVRKLILEYRNT